MGDRETRWVEDYLHCISKVIVQEAVTHGCDTIAFEELTDIRDRMPRAKKFHAWTFRRLYNYVAYKAEAEGIEATQIDPAYTSQRCSQCGTTLRENRPSQAEFSCQKCGYKVNADYNAAKNIGFKMSVRGKSLRTEGRHVTSP